MPAVPPFVSHAWLAEHRDRVVLADVRREVPGRPARTGYDEGHLPGAVLVDLERDLSAPPTPASGRHPLPSPEDFAAAMSRLGIADGDTVVAYDDAAGVVASRLVWMLRVTGRDAAVLDGGPGDDARDREPVDRPSSRFEPRPWPVHALADLDDVVDPGQVVLDARPHERYLGAPDPLDPRPGHLPGARSLPCRENVGADGRLLADDVLRRRLEDTGAGGGRPVVSSCGSGVTACHTLLVLEHLGLDAGRLYVGSWSQYAADPDRPACLEPCG